MKIILLKTSIEPGGALETLYNKLLAGNPYLAQTATESEDGLKIILDDTGSRINLNLNQTKLELLVANGGDIEEGIFAVKVNDSFKDFTIDSGMPFELNAFSEQRTYGNWFVPGAEIYKEDAGTGYIFYSNPGHGAATASQYLKGSQIKTIIDLDATFSVMSTQKCKADYLNPSTRIHNVWTKIDWNNL